MAALADDLDTLAGKAADGDAAALSAIGDILTGGNKGARAAAAERVATLGPVAEPLAPALAEAATGKDSKLRKAALEAILSVGGPLGLYRDALRELVQRGDDSVVPTLAVYGAQALPLIADALGSNKSKVRTTAAQALVEIAGELEGDEVADAVQALLDDDKERYQRLGLEAVARLRRPPASLAESTADLSSLPGARRALLRFDKAWVKRELTSLLNSQSDEERTCGLEIVQQYGASAAEFAPNVREALANDRSVRSAVTAVHTLARLLEGQDLADALEPTLDHWSDEVRDTARRYLEALDVPVRESIWTGHPFSDALVRQLQRFGFKPREAFGATPHVLKGLSIEDRRANAPRREDAVRQAEPLPVAPAVYALVRQLVYPPYELFTVWDSYESTNTFHFSSEDHVFELELQGTRHLFYVIGDGSIGYFACIDLLDTSNDPSLHYIERWWGEGWHVAYTLSSYLRGIGRR